MYNIKVRNNNVNIISEKCMYECARENGNERSASDPEREPCEEALTRGGELTAGAAEKRNDSEESHRSHRSNSSKIGSKNRR